MSQDERLIDIIRENSDGSGNAKIRLVHMLFCKKSKWDSKKNGNMSTYFRSNKKFVFHRRKPGHHEVSISPLSESPNRSGPIKKNFSSGSNRTNNRNQFERPRINRRTDAPPRPSGPVIQPRKDLLAKFSGMSKSLRNERSSPPSRPRLKKPEPPRRSKWPPPKKPAETKSPKPPPRRNKSTIIKKNLSSNKKPPPKIPSKKTNSSIQKTPVSPIGRGNSPFGQKKSFTRFQNSPYTANRAKVGLFSRTREKKNQGNQPSKNTQGVDEEKYKQWKTSLSKSYYINPTTGFEVKGNEIKYPNKNRYVGEIDRKTNKRHGKGTYYFSSTGEKYIGQFDMDKRHGYGIQYYASGKVMYKGEWSQDKFEGNGTYFYPNGEKFVGDWIGNKKNGKGSYFYVKGEYEEYRGDWVNNMKDGIGILKYRGNKGEIEAMWKKNQITKINSCVFK